jgi:hypothetical protein
MAARMTARRPRIPSGFQIMGHKVHVKRIPKTKWKAGKECSGFFDPSNMTIAICSGFGATTQEQTFWHEVTHAIFYCLASEEYDDEKHVDQVGGLLHQIFTTME